MRGKPALRAGHWVIAFLFATSLTFAPLSFAQGTPPNEAEIEAKAAMKRGMAAFAKRDAETALAEYQKAQRLVPDANLPHRYAAEALVELERFEEALKEYETYLRIKPDVSDAGEVQRRMDKVRARMDGSVDITSTPSGAAVLVDGSNAKVGVTPLSGLKLRRGAHTIVLQLPGRKDVVLSPVVRSGESQSLTASFDGAPASPETTGSLAPPAGASPLGWIVLGGGVAVLGTALVLDGVVTASAFDTFEEKRRRDDPTAGDALSSARGLQTASLVTYVAGGVLAAAGLAIVLWPKKASSSVKASAGPMGAFVSGSF